MTTAKYREEDTFEKVMNTVFGRGSKKKESPKAEPTKTTTKMQDYNDRNKRAIEEQTR